MLPGMGPGPTAQVDGHRPPVRPRPGVPEHIRRRRARLAWAVLLLLVITIAAVGWWLGSGRWTDVPKVQGKSQDIAVGLIQEAGLDPHLPITEQFSETVPAGEVISAKPASGRAIRGSDVSLVVSKGPERFVVPASLVGQPKDAVLAALAKMPLQVTPKDQYDNDVASGHVIGFDPPAGQPLKKNTVVTVLVSTGHAPVSVPDVTGQSPDAATKNLQELGFTVTRGPDGRSAAVPKGAVMAVAPGPKDGPVGYGSKVTITVSAGVPQVTVPDVIGKTAKDATKILEAAGLKVRTQTFITGNHVYRQNPEPGKVVDQGTPVTLLLFG
jgi:serine/threonine-protein kinase